ncbi:MAG: site-2 protease family protein [Planctomycetota bacterium]
MIPLLPNFLLPLGPAQGLGTDPAVIAVVVVAAILSLSFHEAAHAWAAKVCGDDTAERMGRLTLNPIAHIDLMMTVLFPALTFYMSGGGMFFGGAKPVPVDPTRLRHPHRDNAFVAIAGPLSNLFLATLFMLAYHLVRISGQWEGLLLPDLLVKIAAFNVLLVVFNLVPIPPLDGSRVVRWLLPDSLRDPYNELERFGMFIILGLVFFFPPFQIALGESIYWVTNGLYQLVTLGGLW